MTGSAIKGRIAPALAGAQLEAHAESESKSAKGLSNGERGTALLQISDVRQYGTRMSEEQFANHQRRQKTPKTVRCPQLGSLLSPQWLLHLSKGSALATTAFDGDLPARCQGDKDGKIWTCPKQLLSPTCPLGGSRVFDTASLLSVPAFTSNNCWKSAPH